MKTILKKITATIALTVATITPVSATSMVEFDHAICIYDKFDNESTYISDLTGFVANNDIDGFTAKYEDIFKSMYLQFATTCVVELDTYVPNSNTSVMLSKLVEREVKQRVANQ